MRKDRRRISALEAVIKNLDVDEDGELVQAAKAKLLHFEQLHGTQRTICWSDSWRNVLQAKIAGRRPEDYTVFNRNNQVIDPYVNPPDEIDFPLRFEEKKWLVRKWPFRGERAAIDHSRRQILRGIFKFFLAGLCQSQFGCHLQIDLVAISYQTWGASSSGTLLGVFLNLIGMSLQLLASRDVFYMYYQIKKHQKVTRCCTFESAAFSFFLVLFIFYALSFLYLVLKVIGFFRCETSVYTLVGGCVPRN